MTHDTLQHQDLASNRPYILTYVNNQHSIELFLIHLILYTYADI